MSNTQTGARPLAVTAVTISALLLLVALFQSNPWTFAAGIAAVIANVLIGVKFQDSRKVASAGAILAALSVAIPPILG